jgi:PAS domain S-box-containing protein
MVIGYIYRKVSYMEKFLLSLPEYAAIVEQAPIMIWRANTTAKCDYFNQRWLEFTGRTLEQEVGDGWAEGVHPEDFQRCLDIYLTNFNNQQIFEMEYRLRRHDGQYRWIFDRGVPFYSDSGEFLGFIGSCIDVTEKVEAQEALRKAQEKEIYQLRGFLPICASCKNIRNDKGYWERIEVYVSQHSEAEFSHGICPDCAKIHYPDLFEETN